MQRVKVYRLNNEGLWDDKGTGHVSVEFMEQSGALGLVVISEADTRTLLIHRISKHAIYHRQGEDTIITWSDPEIGTDIALSFQEAVGCNCIWDEVQNVQHNFHNRHPGNSMENGFKKRMVDEYEQVSAALEGELAEGGSSGPVELPQPEMDQLPELAKILSEVSMFQRDRAAQQMLKPGYVRQLLELFRTCEDLEDAACLAHLYTVMKGAIMLADTNLLELLLSEEHVMDVVGALEYDPELPEHQKHREFLRDHVVFKEVVPIADQAIRAKIHQTYRMGYVKDVILPRVLDDGTFAALSSLMLFNNVEVLMALHSDPRFFADLFARVKAVDPGEPAWRDLVAFLQELCGLAKHLQAGTRGQLLQKLTSLGLFEVMTGVMRSGSDDLRLRATDVLLSALQHDASPMRSFALKQRDHELMRLLMGALLDGEHSGLQRQVLEMLRLLLHPESMIQSAEKDEFLQMFYDNHITQMMDTLTKADEAMRAGKASSGPQPHTLGLIVELLCFCVQHHAYRIKYFVLRNNLVEKVLKLLRCRERWLVVAAVRFLRTCIGLKDEFYHRYLTRNSLFEPLVKAFLDNGERYNLLNSAILELFEYILRENIKSLVVHIVEVFYPRLEHVEYVDTFRSLKLRYEQGQERLTSHALAGTTATSAQEAALMRARHRPDERALAKDEEDYFKEDDDDDEQPTAGPASSPGPAYSNGSTPSMTSDSGAGPPHGGLFGRLVDYDDDDEDDTEEKGPGATNLGGGETWAGAAGLRAACGRNQAQSMATTCGGLKRGLTQPGSPSKRPRLREEPLREVAMTGSRPSANSNFWRRS
ncbi:hypothetical protein WJX72_001481 [[Myrmecia] bisecta]|uniref:Serine/threonine-protein phosphatase 4 regulatory subunit 3-like central domain-containing protein n=1 Tax=[Myrmecia] bisecta TaxID=41462 RepID=A0AAW1P9J6_9CHLO